MTDVREKESWGSTRNLQVDNDVSPKYSTISTIISTVPPRPITLRFL